MNSDTVEYSAAGAEQLVSAALNELPQGYTVVAQPPALTIENVALPFQHYEPDFLVRDPEGRTLMVEVKSPWSMSWSNMAQFVNINRSAQKIGDAFLVVVPGTQPAPSGWPEEFNEVNVAYGRDKPAIVEAVVNALRGANSVATP
jgi:hypothetical protein